MIDRPSQSTVGVVIPTRNRAGMLPFVLHSVLAQTHRPARILVVDNGSSDDTRTQVKGFQQANVEYHFYPHWRSTYDGSSARRHGFRLLSGMDYVASLDDDDYWPPDFLAKLVAALDEEPQAGVAYPSVMQFGDNHRFVPAPAFNLALLADKNWIISGSMVRTQALLSVGGWRGGDAWPEDWSTWRAVANAGWKFLPVPEAVYFYRQSPGTAAHTWAAIWHDRRPIASLVVVLTVHLRPQSFIPQLELIHAQSVRPQQIWAVVNAQDDVTRDMVFRSGLDQVYFANPNSGFYSRFALSGLAQTDWVCLLDDDCLPGLEWFETCLELAKTTDGFLAPWGARVAAKRLYGLSFERPTVLTQVDYIGHAYFMRPEWTSHLFREKLFTGIAGDDIELCARAQRLAGIRSFVTPYPPDCPARWGDTDDQRFGLMPQANFWRHGYLAERDSVIGNEIAKGWQLVRDQPPSAEPPVTQPPIIEPAPTAEPQAQSAGPPAAQPPNEETETCQASAGSK
jgi:glycosyltransferase involved in cell wall biosynthesis